MHLFIGKSSQNCCILSEILYYISLQQSVIYYIYFNENDYVKIKFNENKMEWNNLENWYTCYVLHSATNYIQFFLRGGGRLRGKGKFFSRLG